MDLPSLTSQNWDVISNNHVICYVCVVLYMYKMGIISIISFDCLCFVCSYILTGQIIVATLCAFLMRTRRVWLFSAHLLPLIGRVCLVSQHNALTLITVSMGITAAEVATFLLMNLFVPYRLARATYQQISQTEVNLNVLALISMFKCPLQQTIIK